MTAGQRLWMGGLIKEASPVVPGLLGRLRQLRATINRISVPAAQKQLWAAPYSRSGAGHYLGSGYGHLDSFSGLPLFRRPPYIWAHSDEFQPMSGFNPSRNVIHVPKDVTNPLFQAMHESGHALDVGGHVPQIRDTVFPYGPATFPHKILGQELVANQAARQYLPSQLIPAYNTGADQMYKAYKVSMPFHSLPTAFDLTKNTPNINRTISGVVENPTSVKSVRRQLQKISPEFDQQFRQFQFQNQNLLSKSSSARLFLSSLIKQADEAVGIPSRKNYGDPYQFQPGSLLDYVIQHHNARVRGPHWDLRAGTPQTGLHSWVARQGDYPLQPGQRANVIPMPVHRYRYKDFEGVIPGKVYGAGTVRKEQEGKLLITKTSPTSIHFTEASGPTVDRYALIQPGAATDPWILIKAKNPETPQIKKESYRLIQPDEADSMLKTLMEQGAIAQPKIDGALSYLRLAKGRAEIMSHRTSKRTGGGIAHTERFFGKIPPVDYPKDYENLTLLGELFGERGGKAIPSQELGGILNSGIARSLQKQKDQDVKLKMMLFGVGQQGGEGKPFSMPYDEQRRVLEDVIQHLPNGNRFILPEEATTYEEASKLLEQIQSGEHPLSREGLVIHPKQGVPSKIKFRPEEDVYVRDIFPGAGKYEGTGAGGFQYSYDPEGPIVGRVGSGLSDELRRELMQNPDAYLGRLARVAAQERFPSGALRAPSLLALHEG